MHISRVLWYDPWILHASHSSFSLSAHTLYLTLTIMSERKDNSWVTCRREPLRVVLLCCLVSAWFMWEHHTNNFQLLWPSIWDIYLASNINVSFLQWTFSLSVLVTRRFVHFVLTSEFCCLIYRFFFKWVLMTHFLALCVTSSCKVLVYCKHSVYRNAFEYLDTGESSAV